MPVTNTPTNTTALTVTETLVLSTTQRDALVTLFTESGTLKVRRFKGLMRYHGYTVDQIIAAIHESADRDGVELVIETGARSTMKRTMAIVKPWFATKAHELCTDQDDTRDAVIEYLSSIADYPTTSLEAYAVEEALRADAKVPEWEDVVIPEGYYAEGQPELAISVHHGCGNGAMAAIVEEYVKHRAMSPETACEWLRCYRLAVRFASNERRQAGQEHDSLAASARVGTKDGSNKTRGAKNPGGKDTQGEAKVDAEKQATANAQIAAQKSPGQKTLSEATTHDLIVALTKRVVDYTVALTPVDAKAWDELTGYYDTRFDTLPLGQVLAPAAKVNAAADESAADRQNAINRAPAPINQDALTRAVMAELIAAGARTCPRGRVSNRVS